MSFHAISPAGTVPDLCVEIDFTNDPTNPTRVWTDVTTDVRRLDYTGAGRKQELQRTEAGALTAVMNNRHGNYDATNPSGAYYPGVKRRRWMRVRGRWASIIYPRWQGLIQTYSQTWPESGKDAICTIRATDASMILNLFDLEGQTFGSQTTDARVAAVCALASLPYIVDTDAASTIDAVGPFAVASYALPHLQDVELTENGLLYADAAGSIVFQGRHYRILHSPTAIDTIGDGVGEIPYRDATHELDDGDLATSVTVTPAGGGTPITVSDSDAEAAYFPTSQTNINRTLLLSDPIETRACGEYLLNRYKDSSPRVPAVELLGMRTTAKWPEILAASNSDRFAWKRSAAPHTITEDVYVEQISESVAPGTWQMFAQLSPAIDQAGWVAGVSRAGVDTRANY